MLTPTGFAPPIRQCFKYGCVHLQVFSRQFLCKANRPFWSVSSLDLIDIVTLVLSYARWRTNSPCSLRTLFFTLPTGPSLILSSNGGFRRTVMGHSNVSNSSTATFSSWCETRNRKSTFNNEEHKGMASGCEQESWYLDTNWAFAGTDWTMNHLSQYDL